MRTENFEFIHVLDIGDMGYWVDGVLPKFLSIQNLFWE